MKGKCPLFVNHPTSTFLHSFKKTVSAILILPQTVHLHEGKMLFDCSSVALPPFPAFPVIKTIPICSPGISFPDWLSNLWPSFLPRLESAGTQGQRWGDNRVTPQRVIRTWVHRSIWDVAAADSICCCFNIDAWYGSKGEMGIEDVLDMTKSFSKGEKNDLSDIFQTVAAWVTQLSSAISSNFKTYMMLVKNISKNLRVPWSSTALADVNCHSSANYQRAFVLTAAVGSEAPFPAWWSDQAPARSGGS